MWRPTSKLPTVAEEPAEYSVELRSFQDFILPRSVGRKGSARYVYERNSYEPHLLQSCNKQDWTVPRSQLVEAAKQSRFFVSTHFVYSHKREVYVGSQIADMCLADIIWGSISLTEDHASAILTQVSVSCQLDIYVLIALGCSSALRNHTYWD
jgi:hypothetical protein